MSKTTEITEHWNRIFNSNVDNQLGWFEADVSQTVSFIKDLPNLKTSTVFLAGAGTSILVEKLLKLCKKLVLNDISDVALYKLKQKINNFSEHINPENTFWLQHDIGKLFPRTIPSVDFWIDRAVLHFLIEEEEINNYFVNLHATVKTGGFVLLAEFAVDGAPQCAGLNVHRYTVDEMCTRIGGGFKIINYKNYVYINPFGEERPYIYALFQRDFL